MSFKRFIFYAGILLLLTGSVFAQSVAAPTSTTPLTGESANVYTAISTFFNFLDPTQGAAALLNYIAQLFYNGLLWLYNFIGTFLIPIPDVSQASTFLNGSNVIVNNIYGIFACLGVYVALCGLAINAAVLASGLGRGQVSIGVVVRSAVSIAFIVAWPVIFSFFAQVFTATGYLIFGQNTIETSGMFNALNVMGTTSVSGNSTLVSSNNVTQNNVPNTGSTITQGFQSFWGVAYPICLALCVVGLFIGGWTLARGSPDGAKILIGAVFGLLVVTSATTLISNFINTSSGLTSPGQINSTHALGNGSSLLSFPASAGGGGTNPGVGSVIGSMTNGTLVAVSALLKIIISIWGMVICMGVIFAKFLQIVTLLIIFFLGPCLAGFLSHPATESIAINGFKLMLKNMINSVIWSLALVVLYLLTNINFGAQTLGANNLLMALAVLAGLEIVKDSDKFAQLFANGITVGQGHSTWGNFAAGATGMVAGAVGGIATMSGLAASAVGVEGAAKAAGFAGAAAGSSPHMQLAGAALGAMTPFLGVSGGQKLGQAGAHLFNTVDRLSKGPSSSGGGSSSAPGGTSSSGSSTASSDTGIGLDLKQTNQLLRQMGSQNSKTSATTPTPPPSMDSNDMGTGKT